MQSSPENISKRINIIEKSIIKTIRHGLKENIVNEYLKIIQEDLQLESQDELNLNNLTQQNQSQNNECNSLINDYSMLLETVQLDTKKFETLRDSIDDLTIESIAQKQTLKIEKANEENKIKSLFQSEYNKINQELEQVNNDCNKIEQEVKNQISLEMATKNARIYEIKGNLQRQIGDRKNDYAKTISEFNDVKKDLDTLKATLEQNRYKNTIEFQINHVDQHSNLNKINNDYLSNNLQNRPADQDKSSIGNGYDLHCNKQIDQQHIPEQKTNTSINVQTISNHYLEKVNKEENSNKIIVENNIAYQNGKELQSMIKDQKNLKLNPFSFTTNADTVNQNELKNVLKQSSWNRAFSLNDDDDAILLDAINNSSFEQLPKAHPPRKVPKLYFGRTKKGQFGKY